MFVFLVLVKSTTVVAILNVSCYSLSPPFLGWQFCLVYIYDCLHLLVWCDAKLFGLFYSFLQNRKLLSTFSYCKTF
jgi:hypothetical protein